jgi:hypothetical protein
MNEHDRISSNLSRLLNKPQYLMSLPTSTSTPLPLNQSTKTTSLPFVLPHPHQKDR